MNTNVHEQTIIFLIEDLNGLIFVAAFLKSIMICMSGLGCQ